MIPFSARGRERDRLQGQTFSFDPDAVTAFESAVCAYQNCAFTVAYDTPEAAFAAALFALGLTEDDGVLTAAMAPLSRFASLYQSRAVPHYAEITLGGVIDPRALPDTSGEKVKAVISGGFEGFGTPLEESSLQTIDDLTGSLAPAFRGNLSVWTLESVMPEGAEKTGLVLTDDAVLAERLRIFRARAVTPGTLWNYDIAGHGFDSALSLIGASIAQQQVTRLPSYCALRAEHAQRFSDRLKGNHLFTRLEHTAEIVPASYPLLLVPELYCPKEDIFAAIADGGVEAAVCCKPIYKTKAFRDEKVRLPVTEEFYRALLQLPCHQQLSSEEVQSAADIFLKAVEGYRYRGCRF